MSPSSSRGTATRISREDISAAAPAGSHGATADKKRVSPHRHFRLLHDLELAAAVDAADARPQIGMAGGSADRDAALRRVEIRPEHALLD
jgi:hypothetical protein